VLPWFVASALAQPFSTVRVLEGGSTPTTVWGEVARLEGHDGPVVGATWSADSQRIATAARDSMARIWLAGTAVGSGAVADEPSVRALVEQAKAAVSRAASPRPSGRRTFCPKPRPPGASSADCGPTTTTGGKRGCPSARPGSPPAPPPSRRCQRRSEPAEADAIPFLVHPCVGRSPVSCRFPACFRSHEFDRKCGPT
jgi:hypothetical protein